MSENKKKCWKCQREKTEQEFAWLNKKKGIRNGMCKLCHKEYSKQHYQNNKAKYKERSPNHKEKMRTKLFEYLEDKLCIDCNEENSVVLEFDHRNPKMKKFAVSRGVNNYSWKKILAEIKKCDIRCANCHRIKTAKDRGWYKFLNKS